MTSERNLPSEGVSFSKEVSAGLDYALCVGKRRIENGSVFIDSLDPDLERLGQLLVPVWQKRGHAGRWELRGHDLEDKDVDEVLAIIDRNPRSASVVAQCIAGNIMSKWPIPDGLRGFAWMLCTERTTATKPKAVKPSLTHRNILLVGLAKRISMDCGVPLAADFASLPSDDVKPICGTTIAAAALHSFGVQIKAAQAARILYNTNKVFPAEMLHGPIFAPSKVAAGTNIPDYLPTFTILQGVFDTSKLQKERAEAEKWLRLPIWSSGQSDEGL